jgi:hypothetical protein
MIFSVYFTLKRIINVTYNDYILSGSVAVTVLLIITSILVPIYLYDNSIDKLNLDIAVKFSNIMIPFVTLAGIIMAFLAFFEQKEANNINARQFNLSQIDTVFYQMVANHNSNVQKFRLIYSEKEVRGKRSYGKRSFRSSYKAI